MGDSEGREVRRWTAKRRVELVVDIDILKGKTSAVGAARKHGLRVVEIEHWQGRFLSGAKNALSSRTRDEVALRDEEIERLKQKVGDLVVDLDIYTYTEGMRGHPFGRTMLDESDGRLEPPSGEFVDF